jgi:hypothetical protein
MPHPDLTCVLGEPTHKQLNLILHKLTANLIAISCPWGYNKGHLGLLRDPALYLAQNGVSFDIRAAKPPPYPIVPAGATAHQCKELRAQNTSACKAWTTYRTSVTSLATNLLLPLTTSSTLSSTIRSRVCTVSTSACLFSTLPLCMRR